MRRVIIVVLLVGVASFTPAVGQAQTETVSYYHTDAIGSVRMVTDEAGQVVARYDYQPFGLPLLQYPPPPPERRQFAGKERDTETNLDYFGARYYASGSGRFTSVDPVLNIDAALTDPQRWNRYTYANNNPLRFVDPDGREIFLAQSQFREEVYSTFAQIRSSVSNLFDAGRADQSSWQWVGQLVTDAVVGGMLPTSDQESLSISLGGAIGSGGAASAGRIVSSIKANKGLVKLAEEAGTSVQTGLDALTRQLGQGNLNPGIGTKHLFGNIFYARGRDGARVFFRKAGDTIEILAKGSKHNEAAVIRQLQDLYQ